VSLIPGAITRSDYESNRARYAAQRIVPYCTVGYRSGKYTEKLRQQGVDAVNFEGSIMAWVEAGQPLVTPNGKDTRRVHTWSRQIKAPRGMSRSWIEPRINRGFATPGLTSPLICKLDRHSWPDGVNTDTHSDAIAPDSH
jgi:hypothetical protein